MKIYLVNGNETDKNWTLDNYGVLGMAPNSDYWTYIRKFRHNKEQDFGISSIVYHVDNFDSNTMLENVTGDTMSNLFKNSMMVVRGKLNADYPAFFVDVSKKVKDRWAFECIEVKIMPNDSEAKDLFGNKNLAKLDGWGDASFLLQETKG